MKKANLAGYLPPILAAILGALTIIALIGVRYGEPPWMQERSPLVLASLAAIAYVVGLFLVRAPVLASQRLLLRLLRVVIVGCVVCFALLVLLELLAIHPRKVTLLIELGAVFLLLFVNGVGPLRIWHLLTNVALLLLCVVPTLNRDSIADLKWTLATTSYKEPARGVQFVITSLRDL